MKKINVVIEGTSPLLMHKFNREDIEKTLKRGTSQTDISYEEQAERGAYYKSDRKGKGKELCIPSEVIYASMIKASTFYKISRRSASSILAGSIRIEPFEIGLGISKYIIDIRAVVNRATKGRVLRARAKIPNWKASFKIHYNEKIIPEPETLKLILEEAGTRIGIMDFRPSKMGGFGTFKIIKWEIK